MSYEFTLNVEAAPAREGKQVDYPAREAYLIEKIGTGEAPEAMIGVISGLIDLGLQTQEDAKMEWKGTDAERAAVEAKAAAGESTEYFETLPNDKQVPTLYKRWKVKPMQEVTLTVDFADKMVNQSQFFDEVDNGEEHPYRMVLGNEFYRKDLKRKTVGKTFSLKETRNDDGTWSIKNNTILFKLAQAAGDVLDEKGQLKPAYLGKLLGKAALFEVDVSKKESKGKSFFNENIKVNGQVPKVMQSLITPLDPKYVYGVNFKGPQNLEVLKNLRQSIINTMELATNFEGSDVQKALIEIGRVKAGGGGQAPKDDTPQQPQAQSVPRQSQPAPQPEPDHGSFDDDLPFGYIGLQEGRMFLHMI